MEHAFPEDELRPLSCAPLTRDRENPAHIELNDVLGNYSLTLIDSLSTLAILASSPPEKGRRDTALRDFQDGISRIVDFYGDGTNGPEGQGLRAKGFDLDSKVQVFETVIRGVGGLVSAHQFAVGDLPIKGYNPTSKKSGRHAYISFANGLKYNGQLLRLAQDLAERLLPAFHTPTGLPYPRVNLRHGIPFYASSTLNTDAEHGECPVKPTTSVEITETCAAGAGSLVLEFTTLSRLTGDVRFENAARDAFWAVWDRRSSVGLVGSGIDAETGQWVSPVTGIGAGIDSFFEYAMKSHILLSGLPVPENASESHHSEAFLTAWQQLHIGITRHIYRSEVYQHPHYIQADLYTGAMRAFWIDSLSAYYPGLLTLAGELDEAISTHLLYTALWTRYSALPERWSTATGNIEMGLRWWGGRPEFIESTWYLYRATSDPWYLHVGEMALRDIKRRCWTQCGWAGLQDVRSGELTDRMESFFLGETAKYLYLLFDPHHPLNHLDEPWVLTTEGHPLVIPKRLRQTSQGRSTPGKGLSTTFEQSEPVTAAVCPLPPASLPFTISATAARPDIFHAASLARLHLMPASENISSPLFEFTRDHPSISVSDLSSPNNYTFYPWTLPRDLVPVDGVSSKMMTRPSFDLSFPNLPDSVASIGSLQRTTNGIFIGSMSGLRLGMVRDLGSGGSVGEAYRIQAVSHVALGRDENVYIKRDTVADFNPVDPFFTRGKDTTQVDLIVDVLPERVLSSGAFVGTDFDIEATLGGKNSSILSPENLLAMEASLNTILEEQALPPDEDQTSLFSSLLDNIQNLLSSSHSGSATQPAATPVVVRNLHRHDMAATLSSGPGAAPLPDLPDPPSLIDLTLDGQNDPVSSLPYQSVYIADTLLCDGDDALPLDVVRGHQVLVIRRGGCSFSKKLAHIPAFPPSAAALQLVVIVSSPEYDVEGTLIQPLIETEQRTPKGLMRREPLPLVMVGGGEETIELLRLAKGIGFRRRIWFSTQGVRIGNLIVL